jgi:site-specific DNA-methyltransferase (adenine-specific)
MKTTGTLYLHCDPTASHYLKIVLDSIFGPSNFRNEIIWRRSHPKGHAFTRFARNQDVILAVAKEAARVRWNVQYVPHDPEAAAKQYKLRDEEGRVYQLTSLLNPNPDRPNLTYKFLGVTKVWRWTKERMMAEYEKGRIIVPKNGKGIPRYNRYLDEQEGVPVSDLWTDIEFAGHGERLGYPTQKPLALLERIIAASSNEGDVVLDPFCGCGTAIHAAQRLKRQWTGIDITHLAIAKIENRLEDAFPGIAYEVHGTPKDLDGARDLAQRDKYEFQWWVASLVKFDPAGGKKKKGADRGIDGIRYFKDFDKKHGHAITEKVILSVKGGEEVGVGMIRDLAHVVTHEKAKMGLFVSLARPTAPMVTEALSEGYFEAINGKYPKVQILTVEELFAGKKPDLPPIDLTGSAKAVEEPAEQVKLFSTPNN